MIMTLFSPAISLLLPRQGARLSRCGGSRSSGWWRWDLLVPHDEVAQDIFSEVEVGLEGSHFVRLETEMGYGVEAFVKTADGVGEAAASPLVDVSDLTAPVLDEFGHAFNCGRVALVANVGANQQDKLVISQTTPRRDKAKRPRGRPSTASRHGQRGL